MDRTYPEDWSFVQSNCYQMVSAVCVYDGIDASVRCIAPVAVLQRHVLKLLRNIIEFCRKCRVPCALPSVSSACAKEILSSVNQNCTIVQLITIVQFHRVEI